ncbi:MAG TPA: RuBisCO large subunit C-terminal-like domain-containing protein, partial [Chthoniobacterales bacterium]
IGRPLIGTIIKPSVGLTPDQTAALVRSLGEAGIDFIKDDELMANPPHSPLRERVRAVMAEIEALAGKTGRKIMYAFNVSDDLDAMCKHHDLVRDEGGTCIMVSLNSIGLAALATLRKHAELPIHGHRNGWGLISRHPLLGISFVVYQKLWRLAGADHLHVNGLRNKFWEGDDSVVDSIRACLAPLFGGYAAMPVVSSGQWAGQAPDTFARAKTTDLIFLAGGGIMAHPSGPAAGLRSIQQAWEAAVQGIDLGTYAAAHPELQAALERFGNR